MRQLWAIICLRVHDVSDDNGDIIRPTRTQGELNEALSSLLRRARAQRGLDRLMRHRVRQAIRAQQVPVTRLCVQELKVRLHRTARVRLQNEGLLRVRGHILRLQLALINEGLHEGVIHRDLRQLTVTQTVTARITHVNQAELGAVEHERRQGCAHAILFWVLGDGRLNRSIRILRGCTEQREHICICRVAVKVLHVLNHELGSHLTSGVAPHAVCKQQQVRAGVGRILIVPAHQAAVRDSREIQLESAHGINLTIVRPILMSVPTWTRSGWSMR